MLSLLKGLFVIILPIIISYIMYSLSLFAGKKYLSVWTWLAGWFLIIVFTLVYYIKFYSLVPLPNGAREVLIFNHALLEGDDFYLRCKVSPANVDKWIEEVCGITAAPGRKTCNNAGLCVEKIVIDSKGSGSKGFGSIDWFDTWNVNKGYQVVSNGSMCTESIIYYDYDRSYLYYHYYW